MTRQSKKEWIESGDTCPECTWPLELQVDEENMVHAERCPNCKYKQVYKEPEEL